MATLRGSLQLLARQTRHYLRQRQQNVSTTAALCWNKDWKPGPIPRTPEERAAAAKRYGLRPEDYNCLAEKEAGDYPNLPLVATSWKDPWEDYDHVQSRRNYGEPVHLYGEIIGEELWDPNAEGRYTYFQSLFYCVLIASGFLFSYWIMSPYPYFLPQMPKQYPFNDLYLENGGDPALEQEIKHYTFEPAEEE